ncbi:MAG: tetratricopeptide repeat protein [Bacteroidales bacterium]|nr:tetratricopeptide repeat protein [Bacteroidales bacterium]
MQKTKYLIFVLCMMLFGHTLMGQKESIEKRNNEYQRAVELFEKNKYSSAQKAFKEFLKNKDEVFNDEYLVDAYYYDAVCAYILTNKDAESKLLSFIDKFPQSSRLSMAQLYLANCYYDEKDYKKALAQYRKIEMSQIDKSMISEYEFKFGYSLFQSGNVKKAKDYFSRVMVSNSRYASSASYYYAHIQYMEGDYELALDKFQKLMQDDKFVGIVPYYIAQIYFYLDKNDELIAMSDDLIQKSKDIRKAEIQQMVGEVYYKRNDYGKALDYYLQANDIVSQTNDYQIGYCYYQLKEYEKAAPFLEKYSSSNDSIAQNALYHLGDIYLSLRKKDKARAMFLQASTMDYNPKIKEDALYNYAKLSCEIGNNPYNESIKSLQNYLKLYPETPRRDEINELLTGLYCSVKNYKNALELVEGFTERTPKINEAYQSIVINRGIELFNEYKYSEAIDLFARAIEINEIKQSTAKAYYLKGEAYYQLKNYEKAKSILDKFIHVEESKTSGYYNQGLYTLGYANMKLKQYENSIKIFSEFIANSHYSKDKTFIDDATNRIADNYFVLKSFKDAIVYYDKVINAEAVDADYAMYQKGLSYGALCKYQAKVDCLNLLMSRYPKSKYVMVSNFEIANTFLLNDDQEMALKFYNIFLHKYPKSSYAKEALLKVGVINYNLSNEEASLKALDKVLKNYPGTSESRNALLTIKNIYVNQNRVDEYFKYVKQNTKLSISTVEQDSITFYAAEARYMEADCQAAIPAFEAYLDKFPNGLFTLTANYYLGDCQLRSGSMWKALPYYEYVAKQPKSQYTEVALLNVANITFSIKNYAKSNEYFNKLAETSEIDANILQAGVGIMRTWYLLENYTNTIQSATNLLQNERLTNELKEEASYLIAKSYYLLGDTAAARLAFEPMKQSLNGAYSGEAYYNEAEAYYLRGDMKNAEQVILTITASPVSDYWLAKSFILWADIYYAAGNRLQAKQTLQSIIENYDGDELVEVAQKKYDNIVLEENKAREEHEQQIQQMKENTNEIDMSATEIEEKTTNE